MPEKLISKNGLVKSKTTRTAMQKKPPLIKLRQPDPLKRKSLEIRRSSREVLKKYGEFLASEETGTVVTLEMVAEGLVDTLTKKMKIAAPDPLEKEFIPLRESSWKKLEKFSKEHSEKYGYQLSVAALFDSLCAQLTGDRSFLEWEKGQNNTPSGSFSPKG